MWKGCLVIVAKVDVPFGRFWFLTTYSVLLWIVVQYPTLLESCHIETRILLSLVIDSCDS
jgi:hypothetical protein